MLIAAGLALLFFVYPHSLSGDGGVRFEALAGLLDGGTVSRMPYSMVGPLFAAPLYWLGSLYGTADWWCGHYNVVILAAGVIVASRLTRDEPDQGAIRTFFLLLIAASMFPSHVRGFYGEVFTAVFVGVGILAVQFGRPLLGWTAIVLGTVNTPAALVGLVFIAGKQAWDTKRFRQLVPIVAAAGLILLESWVRHGHPLVTGYEGNSGAVTVLPYSGRPGFSYPLLFGLLSILLSFGKGLLFFAPGLLLPLAADVSRVSDRLRASYSLWMWFLAGLILVYARWWAWYGGWVWGPRFLLFGSVPASLALAVRLRHSARASRAGLAATAVALTLSVWVAINGAAFDQRTLDICQGGHYALEFLCWYVPEFSALWRPFVAPSTPHWGQVAFALYCGLVYVWLIVPLVAALIRSIGADLRSEGPVARALSGWRF
jgi:hypothetical protein